MVFLALAAVVVAASISTTHAGLIYPRPITGPFKLNEVTNTSMACGEDLGEAVVAYFPVGGTVEAQYHRDVEDHYGGIMNGFIRWALVPINSIKENPSASDFDNNVLQYTCNGGDFVSYLYDDVERVPYYELDEKFGMTQEEKEMYNGYVCKNELELPDSLPVGLYKLQFTRFGAVKATRTNDDGWDTDDFEYEVKVAPATPQRTCAYLRINAKDDTDSDEDSATVSGLDLDSNSGSLESIDSSGSTSGSFQPGKAQGNQETEDDSGTRKPWDCWGCSKNDDDSANGSNGSKVDVGDSDSTDASGGFLNKDMSASAGHADSDSSSAHGSRAGSHSSLSESRSISTIDATSGQGSASRSEGSLQSTDISSTDTVVGDDDGDDNRNEAAVTVRKLQDTSNSGDRTKVDLGCPELSTIYMSGMVGGECYFAFTNEIESAEDLSTILEKLIHLDLYFGMFFEDLPKPFEKGQPADFNPDCS